MRLGSWSELVDSLSFFLVFTTMRGALLGILLELITFAFFVVGFATLSDFTVDIRPLLLPSFVLANLTLFVGLWISWTWLCFLEKLGLDTYEQT